MKKTDEFALKAWQRKRTKKWNRFAIMTGTSLMDRRPFDEAEKFEELRFYRAEAVKNKRSTDRTLMYVWAFRDTKMTEKDWTEIAQNLFDKKGISL